MVMDDLTKAVETKAARKYKPVVNIGVNVDTIGGYGPSPANSDWRKEEHQRLSAEVAALEKEMSNFDPKKAAERVRKSLGIKLKLKKLRLEECKLKMNSSGFD